MKWKIQPGESFGVGDALFSIETDKAIVDYEATEKGYLAKVIVGNNEAYPVGKNVAVIVKSKDSVPQFTDFTEGASQTAASPAPPAESTKPAQQETAPQSSAQSKSNGERVFASPLAKNIANSKGIDLADVTGSGPGGRVIKQDVEGYVPKVVVAK